MRCGGGCHTYPTNPWGMPHIGMSVRVRMTESWPQSPEKNQAICWVCCGAAAHSGHAFPPELARAHSNRLALDVQYLVQHTPNATLHVEALGVCEAIVAVEMARHFHCLCHDNFIYVPWCIQGCAIARSCVWHDLLLCVALRMAQAIVAVEMARLARVPRDHMMELIADLQGFEGGCAYSHSIWCCRPWRIRGNGAACAHA